LLHLMLGGFWSSCQQGKQASMLQAGTRIREGVPAFDTLPKVVVQHAKYSLVQSVCAYACVGVHALIRVGVTPDPKMFRALMLAPKCLYVVQRGVFVCFMFLKFSISSMIVSFASMPGLL